MQPNTYCIKQKIKVKIINMPMYVFLSCFNAVGQMTGKATTM